MQTRLEIGRPELPSVEGAEPKPRTNRQEDEAKAHAGAEHKTLLRRLGEPGIDEVVLREGLQPDNFVPRFSVEPDELEPATRILVVGFTQRLLGEEAAFGS